MESDESSNLFLKITNKGKGTAQDLLITVNDNFFDPEFNVKDNIKIPFIYPEKSFDVIIPIKAGFNIQSAEHKLEINITEHFGYDMDKAYLILNTMEYQKPKLVFSGLEVVDYGEGTMAREQDNLLQAGEQVKIKMIIQNIGQNIAKNTKYKITTNDENIYIVENSEGNFGDLTIGEVKNFWITISPNRRVTTRDKLPVFLTLKEDIGRGNLNNFQIPLYLDQQAPEIAIVEVEPDIEMLRKQKYDFVTTSDKFTVNVDNLINIKEVVSSNTKRSNSVAVIFGVENYTDLPPAPYAKNDAEIVKEYFKKRLGVGQVVIYTNEQVSGFVFDTVFNPDYGELQKAVLKGQSDLFVFYSGHGVPSKDGENIYLFPFDGKVAR
ncbi:caspase family protein, partial [bacterium]|nr:caspase family protein [bacterium]